MMPNPNVSKSPMVLFDVQNDIAGNQDGSVPANLKTPADYYREMFSPGVEADVVTVLKDDLELDVVAVLEGDPQPEPAVEEIPTSTGKNSVPK